MCDTFVALGSQTADGSVIFGKNSDREPNEAQSLEYHGPADYPSGTMLACTHIAIPQARHTHGVLISRPHWMWGAEMGGNDRGVVIGNEAVWARLPPSRAASLIGMDLLRLALERAGSAREALDVIVGLLARHGQGGLHSRTMVYHNSYIIADVSEAWVLETVGRLWAAARVRDSASISNGLTIGEEIDECSPGLADEARRLGLLPKGRTFHFARCLSDRFYTTFTASGGRRRRSMALLGRHAGKLREEDAFAILRDHGEAGAAYLPDRHLLMRHLCAHAANPLARDAAQSTGSLVACLGPAGATYWATGTSAPCTSLFKPIWTFGQVLPDTGGPPGPRADGRSLWWRHELLHRAALGNLPEALARIQPRRARVEDGILRRARQAASAAPHDRYGVTVEAFGQGDTLDRELLELLRAELPPRVAVAPYRSYWRRANRAAGIGVTL